MVELVLPVHNPESNSIDGVVVMNFSLNSVNTLYDSMQSIAITLVLVLGLIILVISVLYSGQIVMPMKEVAGSIAMISSGDFNETMQRIFPINLIQCLVCCRIWKTQDRSLCRMSHTS